MKSEDLHSPLKSGAVVYSTGIMSGVGTADADEHKSYMVLRRRLKRKNRSLCCLLPLLLLTIITFLLPACGSDLKFGDVGAVKEATELAIACKTDEALAVLDRATQGGGLGAGVGDLQRVVILRDAGRMAEADAAMADRNQRWNVDAKNAAEAEKAVAEAMEQLQAERQKRTGRRTCD